METLLVLLAWPTIWVVAHILAEWLPAPVAALGSVFGVLATFGWILHG